MRPKAAQAKEHAIKNDLKGFCDILVKEYQTIIGVYNSLSNILKIVKQKLLVNLMKFIKNIQNNFSLFITLLKQLWKKLHKRLIKYPKKKTIRFEESKGFLGEKIEKVTYETYWINADNIYKTLFYDDQTIDKMFKDQLNY